MNRRNVWETWSDKTAREAMKFCDGYKAFLDDAKTEREAVDAIIARAEKAGFIDIRSLIGGRKKLKKGDKVYCVWMNKTVAMFRIGGEPMENGINILGAHIDSPRTDVKQNPLYEDNGIAYLDTHYYGGIKKYQYVAMPLAIHGVIVKKDQTTVCLNIGEDPDDPVFFISDLLIHLAQDQMEKKASKVIEGEALDLVIGNRPLIIDSGSASAKEKNAARAKLTDGQRYAQDVEKLEGENGKKLGGAVRKGILAILKDNYGVEEDDFISAEIEIVPAGKARDAGLDRSMILAYGQDDRVCAYPSLMAMVDTADITRTACCLLVDKEEIGSVGATGMRSRFFENMLAEVMNLTGTYSELALRRCLANSCMLSSDVNAAFDPQFASAFEKKNASFLGGGMAISKFTGARGKSGSNDANAEYLAHLRDIFDEAGVVYHTAELGKVDVGGGGTIAYILALYGMNVIDSGVSVLNMHAPWEATSKADVYESYRGYCAFLSKASLRNI